jgi:hypothetical protein
MGIKLFNSRPRFTAPSYLLFILAIIRDAPFDNETCGDTLSGLEFTVSPTEFYWGGENHYMQLRVKAFKIYGVL